jgi:hypothetical protein
MIVILSYIGTSNNGISIVHVQNKQVKTIVLLWYLAQTVPSLLIPVSFLPFVVTRFHQRRPLPLSRAVALADVHKQEEIKAKRI